MLCGDEFEATVVKVGGSLYELPELGVRLRTWVGTRGPGKIVLVPGGGATVDAIRRWDDVHGLGEETAHWLALRALRVNAALLAALLPGGTVVEDVGGCRRIWELGGIPIMDMEAFARADEANPRPLPHSWSVTSDSLAARLAQVIGAHRLILLKSVDVPPHMTWDEAGHHGFVDPYFPQAVGRELSVEIVNLRR